LVGKRTSSGEGPSRGDQGGLWSRREAYAQKFAGEVRRRARRGGAFWIPPRDVTSRGVARQELKVVALDRGRKRPAIWTFNSGPL